MQHRRYTPLEGIGDDDEDDDETNPKLMLVLYGECGVGKSSICARYTGEDEWLADRSPTVGVAFFAKTIAGSHTLHVWDTSGDARYYTATCAYIRDASLIFFVYDVSACQTFDALLDWMKRVDWPAHQGAAVIGCLLANKVDVPAESRCVSREQGERFASEHDLYYAEVSAKEDGGSIASVIDFAAQRWIQLHHHQPLRPDIVAMRNSSRSSRCRCRCPCTIQ